MNIFVLDANPKKAADYHCNKHVVKMILETCQMLCTAHWMGHLESRGKRLKDFKRMRDAQLWLYQNVPHSDQPPWKMTHVNHPCTIWARENTHNYQWLSLLGLELCFEYTRRYGKTHKTESLIRLLHADIPPIPETHGMTAHPQCVPDECKVLGDPVLAYRNYYKYHKRGIARWEPRSKTPLWYVLQETENV